jgi:hypothetical protein
MFMAPVQRINVREITDPAEQAAIDADIKRRELAAAQASNGEGSMGKRPTDKLQTGKAKKSG